MKKNSLESFHTLTFFIAATFMSRYKRKVQLALAKHTGTTSISSKVIFILFSIFPTVIFSQANSDYAKIKKDGIQQVQLFENKTDSFPATVLYYDKVGRLRKVIHIDQHYYYSIVQEAFLTEYDSLGRITKNVSGYSAQRDVEKMKFARNDIYSTTYIYLGDSAVITIDSSLLDNRLMGVYYKKESIYWQKIPPPNPRPILWPDSIESSYTVIQKHYQYWYQDEKGIVPIKIDSIYSTSHFSYVILNGKLVGTGIFESHEGDTITIGDSKRIYTLNGEHDTVTWVNNSKKSPASRTDILLHFDNYHYAFVRTIETKHSGKKYIVTYSDHTEGEPKKKKPEVQTVKSKEPWNNYIITSYFPESILYQEDLTVDEAKSRFSAVRVEKIKY